MNQRNDSSGSRRRTQGQSNSSRSYVSSGKSGSSSVRRSGYKKKKPKLDITHYLMYGFGVLILIVCVVMLFKGCRKTDGADVVNTEAQTSVEETELKKQVSIDGVDITGMTREEAREAVTSHYQWGMTVTYNGETADVNNLIATRIDKVLDEIYLGEPKEIYEIDTSDLTAEITSEVERIATRWDKPAKNGGIESFDQSTGKFTFTDGASGVVIDKEKLTKDMESALAAKTYDVVLKAQGNEVTPTITAAQAREKYVTLGTYTTTTTANKDRNENIRLASNALNGVILQPGDVFSFNDTTGERTVTRGYKPAGAYVNGELVEEPGGGVCQVSSTLYNAVVFSGLKTTERQPHSYEPSYVTPGEDAMVNYGTSDMKFVNNSEYPVAIRASFADRKLTTSIYGIRILPEGTKVRMRSEKTDTIAPPASVYEEDQTLQLTEEKVVKEGTPGSRWKTYLVTYEGDTKVGEEFFHTSNYRGKAGIIKRNTSGVVVTTAAPVTSESPMESSSAGTGDNPMESTAPNQPTMEPGPGAVSPTQSTTQAPGPAATQAPTQGNTQAPTNPGPAGPGDGASVTPNPGGPAGNTSGPGGPG